MNIHHQTKHSKEYVGYCRLCCKGFKSNLGYELHKKMHDGETGSFEQCTVCGKLFHGQSRLITHMRCHSEEKTFVCLVCNKSYKHKKNLQQHNCSAGVSEEKT